RCGSTATTGAGFVGANCAYGSTTSAAGAFTGSSTAGGGTNFGCCAGNAGRNGISNGPPNGCNDTRYGCSVVVLFVVLLLLLVLIESA
ncbi:unnamed protein product, partial [Rotaria socialis]